MNAETPENNSLKKKKLSKKARQKKIIELRERIHEKLRVRLEKKGYAPRPPRYDEVFAKGQRWLDEISGGEIPETHGELTFTS
jgi:ribosomal protein S19E (S16A)